MDVFVTEVILGNGDPNHPIVQLEVEEFREKIKLDGSDKRWWDFKCVYSLQLSISL